jgi:hypothetical protein
MVSDCPRVAWGLGFGLGCGGIALGGLYYYSVKHEGWDTRAVGVESAEPEGIGQVGMLAKHI